MTANEDTAVIDQQEDQDIRAYVRALEERVMKLESVVLKLTARVPGYAIDYGAPNNTNDECMAHTCSYYTHYLVYGPADLEHEGYHAAEKAASQHIRNCSAWETANRPCQLCQQWESRIRA